MQRTISRIALIALLGLSILAGGCTSIFVSSLPKVESLDSKPPEGSSLSAYIEMNVPSWSDAATAVDNVAKQSKLFAWHSFNPAYKAKADLRLSIWLTCELPKKTESAEVHVSTLFSASAFEVIPSSMDGLCSLTGTVINQKDNAIKTYTVQDNIKEIAVETLSLTRRSLYFGKEALYENQIKTLFQKMLNDGALAKVQH